MYSPINNSIIRFASLVYFTILANRPLHMKIVVLYISHVIFIFIQICDAIKSRFDCNERQTIRGILSKIQPVGLS